MKNILLIEHGGKEKKFIFDFIKDDNYNYFIATTNIPEWLTEIIPEKQIISTDVYDSTVLINDVSSFMQNTNAKFDAVVTFFEHTVVQASKLAKHLGLKGIDEVAAQSSSSNKFLMRNKCKDEGVNTPKFKLLDITDVETFKKELTEFGLPCVVKPVFGSQSYGVKKVESKDTLHNDIEEILALTKEGKKEVFKQFTGQFLVEEYMSGKVISVDGIVNNNEVDFAGIVEFVMGKEPNFTQIANYIPPRISEELQKQCFAEAEKIVKALGFNNCGFHCEMRLTETGPKLIEIAARLPGGPLQIGYRETSGINLPKTLVSILLNEKTKLQRMHNKFILQKAVFPDSIFTIQEIKGIEEVKSISGILDFVQICDVDEVTITYPDIPKPLYYYSCISESQDQLEKLSETIEKAVTFSPKTL